LLCDDTDRELRERYAACVNACQGMPTDDLQEIAHLLVRGNLEVRDAWDTYSYQYKWKSFIDELCKRLDNFGIEYPKDRIYHISTACDAVWKLCNLISTGVTGISRIQGVVNAITPDGDGESLKHLPKPVDFDGSSIPGEHKFRGVMIPVGMRLTQKEISETSGRLLHDMLSGTRDTSLEELYDRFVATFTSKAPFVTRCPICSSIAQLQIVDTEPEWIPGYHKCYTVEIEYRCESCGYRGVPDEIAKKQEVPECDHG